MSAITPPQKQRSTSRTPALPYSGPFSMSNGTYLTACPRHPWAAPNVIVIPGGSAVCLDGGHTLRDDELRVAA